MLVVMFTRGMLSTCLNDDSTIVWTQHPFTWGLLRTITCMDYGGSQPAVIGIDRSMSIINMLRFPLYTCWLCVNYFERYYAIIKLVCSPLHFMY
ncbi:hypothetical protein HanRHA438_Chr04g0170811 [Helianthus annuus]|nr:hypothetical protein HanRHA438_Chr04g0170811 [Helianthus annuus]